MEKNKKAIVDKVSSRNRNKNKNKTLQIRAKEKEQAKKEKAKRVAEKVENAMEEVRIDDVITRDEIIVVPDRKNVSIDSSFLEDEFIEVETEEFKFVDYEDEKKFSDKFSFLENEFTNEEDSCSSLDEELEEFNINFYEEDIDSVYNDDSSTKIKTFNSKEYEMISKPDDRIDINAKKHISFEKRIVALLTIIVVSFFIAGLLIFKAITSNKETAITFDEKSIIDYNVCINELTYGQYYNNSCLDEGMEYLTSISERMPVNFKYQVDYSENVDKTLDYYIVSNVVISKGLNGKVLNSMEEVLVDRTSYSVFGNSAELSIDVDIPFKKYVDYVNSYNLQFNLTSYATLETIFYVDNGITIKKVAALSMPLSANTFNIEEAVINNERQSLNVVNNDWSSFNASYAVVGLVFVLIGLFGIIKLADLVYKAMGTSSLYQRKLNKILREYDRHIVIARGEYNIDPSKRLIKVTSFGELLDARDTLEKPIVYLKINNVKSEFYVEDSEIIYKYTMKEVDLEGK